MADKIEPKKRDLRDEPSNPSGRIDAGTTPKTSQDGLPGVTLSTGEDEATPDSPLAEGQTSKM
jgi:hypothetical protein